MCQVRQLEKLLFNHPSVSQPLWHFDCFHFKSKGLSGLAIVMPSQPAIKLLKILILNKVSLSKKAPVRQK